MFATPSVLKVAEECGVDRNYRSSLRKSQVQLGKRGGSGVWNVTISGNVRIAALAAHKARQVHQKRAASAAVDGMLESPAVDFIGDAQSIRDATPVVASPPARQPFHVKKRMNLKLMLDEAEPVASPMMVLLQEGVQATRSSLRKSVVFSDQHLDYGSVTSAQAATAAAAGKAALASAFQPRRTSSITISMNSPEGAEYQEVAHDGPEELGKRTKRVKKLGKGAGGTVFLSLYLPALKLVAVKEVLVYQEAERQMVKHELHALHDNLAPIEAAAENLRTGRLGTLHRRLFSPPKEARRDTHCPYLVAFYGAFLKPTKCAVSVVMEFMDMGSAQDLLDAHITVSEPVLRHAAFCCITALDHMHSRRMIHRDIKPANILMNRHGDFKVADFGLAGTLAKSKSFFSEFQGTMMYMAPERISGAQYSYVSDIWSLGIALFSLATGAFPFAVDDGFFGLEEAICADPLPPMPNRFSPEFRGFIKKTLNRDPMRRLSSSDALSHPFLSGYADTPAYLAFPSLWQELQLKRAVSASDARVVANLAVDYSQRYPSIVALPREITSAEASEPPSTQCSTDKRTLFHQFTGLFGHGINGRDSSAKFSLPHLAEECGVTTAYLQNLFQQVGSIADGHLITSLDS